MNTMTYEGCTARIEFDERDNIAMWRSHCAMRSSR